MILIFIPQVLITYYYCCSVVKSCTTLWNPMDCSMPGFPVLYYLLEFAQTLSLLKKIHWVGDSVQQSHPLSTTSPTALNLPQCQGLVQWVGSLHQVAKVLELQLQHQSFQWIYRSDFLLDWLVCLCSPWDSQEFSSSPVQKHQFFCAQPSLWSISVCDSWEKHSFDLWTFDSKVMSLLFNTLSRFIIGFLPRRKHLLSL